MASVAGMAGLVGLSTYAVNAAISYDTLSRSLTAITKSGERAKQVLNFADVLAGPSVFGSEELASAALTLEAFGLKTEKYLPVVEKLGTIFGGTAGDMMQFVNSLGMLKGGRSGEAFESLISGAGRLWKRFDTAALTAGSNRGG